MPNGKLTTTTIKGIETTSKMTVNDELGAKDYEDTDENGDKSWRREKDLEDGSTLVQKLDGPDGNVLSSETVDPE